MLSWLAMGSYWPFVWGAYGMALLGLAGVSLWAWRAHAAVLRDVARLAGQYSLSPKRQALDESE
jgi:heme exporter protein D